MKTLKLYHEISVSGIRKVEILNELFELKLTQSNDEKIHIETDLNIKNFDFEKEKIAIEDIIEVRTSDHSVIQIILDNSKLENKGIELSRKSEVTVYIPNDIEVKAVSDNFSMMIKDMQNLFILENENGSINLVNIKGDVQIKTENGNIKLKDIKGNLKLDTENGSISGEELKGSSLKVVSENGSIKIRHCSISDVSIVNENGIVYYESDYLEKGNLSIKNENGSIYLILTNDQGFKLSAESEKGLIINTFLNSAVRTNRTYTTEIGNEALNISLKTENGTIKISSNDNVDADFLKGKFDYIRDKMRDLTEESLEDVLKSISQLISYLKRMIDSFDEESIKTKLEKAIGQLQEWKEKITDPNTHEKIKQNVEQVANEVQKIVKETLKNIKEKVQKEFRDHFHSEDDKDNQSSHFFGHFRHYFDEAKIQKKLEKLKKFGITWRPSSAELKAMQDKSRKKILEMLESGKITAEEAEKLLRAIDKD